jgi:hypothetical protein
MALLSDDLAHGCPARSRGPDSTLELHVELAARRDVGDHVFRD